MQNQELSPSSPSALKPCKRVEGTHQIQRFFWAAAGLDVDKDDLRRYYNFVDQKVADLLLIASTKRRPTTESGWSCATFLSPRDCRRAFMRLRHSTWISASSASWRGTFQSRPSIYLTLEHGDEVDTRSPIGAAV
jgi:hypothetical protein